MNNMVQKMVVTEYEHLLPAVREYHDAGWRLVQISCAKIEEVYEITYSFDKGLIMEHLRIIIGPDVEISSITCIYLAAFTYENEIADLYGIPIQGIAIDYKGKFITTSIPHPFKGTVTTVKKGGAE
ncbi:MAG TPA: NADH-quinone oxidoreductase subunit C [Methanospirillum sp.]|nr:NADH-quinone oxidoreductase subunit C [Methanospirillum sp.]